MKIGVSAFLLKPACQPVPQALVVFILAKSQSRPPGVQGNSQPPVSAGYLGQRPMGVAGWSEIKTDYTIPCPDAFMVHGVGLHIHKP